MRASTETLLSLLEFADIMGIDPFEMGQFTTPQANARQCEDVFYQFSYQQDFLSREEVARTIKRAEDAIALELGFQPGPVYCTETVEYPAPAQRDLFGAAGTHRGQWKALTLGTAKVIGGGSLARTQIDAGAAVVLSDNDGDSIKETFTVGPFATTITDPDEIAIYFTATDRNSAPLDETWRIRPVRVAISGGNATITGHAALLAKPDLTLKYNATALDVGDATNFAATVEVQRVYRDTTATDATPAQGYALWEQRPDNPCADEPCSQTTRAICIGERYAEMGQVFAAFSDPTSCWGWREPDRVSFKYLAGVPRAAGTGRMNNEMAEIVAHLAAAWLPVLKCGCERSNRILAWWQGLPSDEEGRKARPVTFEEINTPFGERRGAVYAWKRVQRLAKIPVVRG
jgi:hypothetical protein